jgi:hypothetical protein
MPICPPSIVSGRWRRSRPVDRPGVFHILWGLSVESPVENPLRPCPESPSVRLPYYWATRIRPKRSGAPGPPLGCVASEGGAPFVARRAMNLHGCAPAFRAPFLQIPAFKSGCAASEGRASFVARRAVNLHGCALPHSALPPAAAPPDPLVVCAFRAVFPIRCRIHELKLPVLSFMHGRSDVF